MGFILKFSLISLGLACLLPLEGLACHKGGPMGLAKGRPGVLSADFTYSSTFVFASTSGTSGCKNWDFVKFGQEAQKKYIAQKWDHLSEEAARGNGPHLQALAQLMGCPSQNLLPFNQFIQKHYTPLFDATPSSSQQKPQHFLMNLKKLIAEQKTFTLSCQSFPPEVSPS